VRVVGTDMIFAAKVLLFVFLGPASFNVFLPLDIWIFLEAVGGAALFDLFVLFPAVALPRNVDETGIDDLSLSCFVSL